MATTHISFSPLQRYQDFQVPLEWANKITSKFSLTKKNAFKNLTVFFKIHKYFVHCNQWFVV